MRSKMLLATVMATAFGSIAVGAVAGAASAEVVHHGHLYVHRDARGDVEALRYRDFHARREPHRRDRDITRVRARYGHHTLRLSIYFASMDRRPAPQGDAAQFVIKSSNHMWSAEILTTRSHPHGKVWFGDFETGSGGSCTIGHSVNDARAREQIIIPAHCIDSASSVRIAFDATAYYGSYFVLDAGIERGTRPIHDHFRFSPRVYR